MDGGEKQHDDDDDEAEESGGDTETYNISEGYDVAMNSWC